MHDMSKQVRDRVEKEARAMAEDEDQSKPFPPGFIISCLDQSERGDGILYCYLNKDKFVYNNNTGEMLEWGGHYWKLDKDNAHEDAVEDVARCYEEEADSLWERIKESSDSMEQKKLQRIQESLRKRAVKLRSNRGVENCIKFAKRVRNPEIKLTVDGNKFDTHPFLLACQNGVIDLKTGKFRDGRPEDYISLACPVEYKGIDEVDPEWDQTVEQILNNDRDNISFVRRLFGYGISGSTEEHIFPVFQGRGRNGKSLLIDVISHVLGPLAAPIRSEMLLSQPYGKNSSGPAPDIMALKGLRIAVASETDERSSFSSAQVKLLSGGDWLSARNPHDKYQTHFKPSHLLILLTNDKPRAPDNDLAFWKRVRLVEFPISFVSDPKEPYERLSIKGLAEKLKKKGPAILAWLVRGHLEYREQGLNPPEKVMKATMEYQREGDLLGEFIEDRCVVDPYKTATSKELYDEYSEWYESNVSKKVPSQHFFGKRMKAKFTKRKSNGIIVYQGIGLRQASLDSPKED